MCLWFLWQISWVHYSQWITTQWIKSFINLFKTICTSLRMMQSPHPQILRNLGVILRTCGGIKNLHVVSLISNFYVTELATLTIPPLLDGFIISLWRYPTEISINIFGKKSYWFDSGLKKVTTSLDTHNGLTLGWDSIH